MTLWTEERPHLHRPFNLLQVPPCPNPPSYLFPISIQIGIKCVDSCRLSFFSLTSELLLLSQQIREALVQRTTGGVLRQPRLQCSPVASVLAVQFDGEPFPM
ncbi:hypothetical protein VPH35_053337 [Triticum aestivum]